MNARLIQRADIRLILVQADIHGQNIGIVSEVKQSLCTTLHAKVDGNFFGQIQIQG